MIVERVTSLRILPVVSICALMKLFILIFSRVLICFLHDALAPNDVLVQSAFLFKVFKCRLCLISRATPSIYNHSGFRYARLSSKHWFNRGLSLVLDSKNLLSLLGGLSYSILVILRVLSVND